MRFQKVWFVKNPHKNSLLQNRKCILKVRFQKLWFVDKLDLLSNKINENLKVTLIMYKFPFKKIEAKLVVLDIQNSFAKPFFAKKAL